MHDIQIFVEISPVSSVVSSPTRLTLCLVQGDFPDGNGRTHFIHCSFQHGLRFFRLFLTEGIATVLFGIAIWFLLPDCETPLHPKAQDITYRPVTNRILL